MNILLKSEDEAKVLCHGHTKKLFLLSWNALILRVEINIELLASYLSANSVPDSKNNHSKPWLTFKLSLYLSFGSVGSCSFSHLMISLQIIFQKCTMKCRKSHVFLLSSLWTLQDVAVFWSGWQGFLAETWLFYHAHPVSIRHILRRFLWQPCARADDR